MAGSKRELITPNDDKLPLCNHGGHGFAVIVAGSG